MVNETRFDVVCIGNALVDVIAHVEDDFLDREGLQRGAMTLVDAERAEYLYGRMPPALEISGGSAGNTVAGIASLGGRAAYIGKVADDQLGAVFRHDMRAGGVAYDVPPSGSGTPTGRCLIAVTPDAQRTMSTYLGAGVELGPDDIDDALIGAAAITYLEGYLWDPPEAKQAFLRASKVAHDSGRRVSLTLSDSFCVDRHRAEFLDLIDGHVDVLFANEHEIMSLYETDSFDEAVERVRGRCEIAALTRSEKGSVVLTGMETYIVAPEPGVRLVDTTGAGDLYAAGFLFGLTHGADVATCGRIASVAAAEVISHFGARPEVSLAKLLRERGVALAG